MVEDGMHVRRKDRLRMIVDRKRGIGPPQERLWQRCSIIQLDKELQIGLSWVEREARGHFRPIHPVDFADPDGFAAISVMPGGILDRAERIRAVMLRPIELDSTRNPGTGQSD